MTDLYLVRHGETAWSKSGQHTSLTDLELTERGIEQARALRGRLNPADFGLALSSPRRRALRTAELAGFGAVKVDEDLAEWYYGDYEGLTSQQIRERRRRTPRHRGVLDHVHDRHRPEEALGGLGSIRRNYLSPTI